MADTLMLKPAGSEESCSRSSTVYSKGTSPATTFMSTSVEDSAVAFPAWGGNIIYIDSRKGNDQSQEPVAWAGKLEVKNEHHMADVLPNLRVLFTHVTVIMGARLSSTW